MQWMSDREHGFVQRKNYIPYIVRDIQTTNFNKVWICLFMKYKNLLSIILLYLYWHVQLLSLHQRKLGNFMVIIFIVAISAQTKSFQICTKTGYLLYRVLKNWMPSVSMTNLSKRRLGSQLNQSSPVLLHMILLFSKF